CLAVPLWRHAAVVVSRRHRDLFTGFFTCVFRVFPGCLCCPRHLCKRPFLFCWVRVSFAMSVMHPTSAARVRAPSAAAGSQLWRHWVHAGVCFYTGKEAEKTIPRADAGDGGSREGDTGSRRLVHGPHYNVVWRYMLVLAMVAAGQVTKAVELAADAARLVTDAAGPETEAGRRRR
ncbi:hypothetical protein Vretimale_20055, partial [Volvox reticuliferus]